MKINILTTTEETIMLTIWKLGEPFTKDILGALPDPKMHPNTLSTFLKILTDKGFLKTEKIGRIFKYIP
ncbi:MAG: BlaI/MecI/CopY family transcriptional regulator, partial [Bergeyella zoohelcum]|nr:BlaI/MecI/CopY family transcriptional regulator [Bergeyella zoohelcum]